MRKTITATILIISFFLNQRVQSEPLHLSFSSEFQSFYLNPKNSSQFFSKYEIKTIGEYDLNSKLQFRTNASLNTTYLEKQDQKKVVLNPTDFGLYGSTKYFDYQIGSWVFTPEGTDLNNIFDVIHGKDYRQPFNSESLASWGLLTKAHFYKFDYSLFYIPKNLKSILPDTQSPWWPRTSSIPISNSSGTFNLPDNTSYIYKNESDSKKAFENNFGGFGKISFNYFDLYAFYYSGANQIPQITPHFNINVISVSPLIGNVTAPIDIDLNWIKSEHIGGGVSATLDPFIFKSFCKNQTDYYSNEQLSSVNCTGAIESSLVLFKKSLHYFLQINRTWKSKEPSSDLQTLLGFFEKSSAFGFMLNTSDESNLYGAVIYNEKSPAVLSSIRFEKNWSDQFKTNIGINILTVQDEPLTKSYDSTDNLTAKLTYTF